MRIHVKNTAINYLFLLVIQLIAFTGYGQNWKSSTNSAYLKTLSANLDQIYKDYKASVEQYALEREILIREVMTNGSTVSLIRIMPSGIPEYYKSDNFKASQNVGTSKLRPKASLSLNLTGKNFLIGVWDSGSINSEHQELVGRVDIRDNIPFDDHGTHVAGTIGATGINPQAKGMAYEANMFAYEFNNDNAEMADEAAKGLTVSNHSYGLRTGWDVSSGGTGWQWFGDPAVSNVEDYRFGYYDASNSRVWDDIAYNAPYYLIIKSAGNDRTDVGDGTRPPDGPYDCLEPKSVAKNILTIGAVAHLANTYTGPDDVIMSEFSSWGPTDDGRIKPDISAIGVDVFSALAESVTAYGLLSGTSMSAPNTTGSLALLQEYHAQLYSGDYMKAATLKGLVIHCANEAGKNPGPDYEFGWGLLAIDKAANLMTRNDGKDYIIDELNLVENDSIIYNVNSDGTKPLIATICWTDVPGAPAPISLNPTKLMLINDLDIRIYDESEKIYYPWILNPSTPDKAASTGDNFRDNVEKIEIKTPTPGAYRIVIKHKSTLRNNNQDFSLIVSTSSLDLNLATFYRIGGSGDWNDPTKWSLNSGGAVANAIPGIDNPVIFDNNSFTNPTNTITLTSNASCYNLNYYTTDSCSINLASFALNIDGSIFDENNKISINNGKISFKGIVSKNNQILVSPEAFRDLDLEFVSTNGSWNIEHDFTAKNLTVQNSSLFVKNKNINAKAISINNTQNTLIDFSGSTITGVDVISASATSPLDLSNSTVFMSNTNGNAIKTISANNVTFNNIDVENAELTVNGNNTFNGISVNGLLTLLGDNTLDSLSLTVVSSLTLGENTTQTLKKSFEATGLETDLIEIQSNGTGNAEFFGDNGNIRFCFDYLNVSNVSVSGATGFLSGDHSTISASSTGWIELDCNDALFPSFNVLYPCAMGQVKFVDTSTGFPTQWAWSFGNLQFPDENASTQQNPFHNFRFEGDYEVTFNVKNSLFDQSITRTISIIDYESSLGVPSININGTKLTSSIIAPSYQWYVNNNPIIGATERIHEIANPGIYYVTVSDDNCLFKSEPTVVTGLSEELESMNFSVYPNPSIGEFTLKMVNDYFGKGEIRVFDLFGNHVLTTDFNKNTRQYKNELNLPSMATGIYSIIITTNQGSYTQKLIITR